MFSEALTGVLSQVYVHKFYALSIRMSCITVEKIPFHRGFDTAGIDREVTVLNFLVSFWKTFLLPLPVYISVMTGSSNCGNLDTCYRFVGRQKNI
jgi:hypothetical protein